MPDVVKRSLCLSGGVAALLVLTAGCAGLLTVAHAGRDVRDGVVYRSGKTYDVNTFQRRIAAQNTLDANGYGSDVTDHLRLSGCRVTRRHRSRCRWTAFADDVRLSGVARFRTRFCDVYTTLSGTRVTQNGKRRIRLTHVDPAPDWLCM